MLQNGNFSVPKYGYPLEISSELSYYTGFVWSKPKLPILYLVTKFCVVYFSFFFFSSSPYFCLYLNFTFANFGLHGPYHMSYEQDALTVSRWVLWCLALSEELLNALVHPGCWQTYGFSPVWDLRWILRFSNLEKALRHPSNWRRGKQNKNNNVANNKKVRILQRILWNK